MSTRKKKNVNLNALVRMFLREYNIPTKKDVDRLMARIDRLEQLIKLDMESSRPKRPQPKVGSGKAASDEVLAVIQDFQNGIQFAKIKNITGFEEKKLRNIIYRLHRMGKIERINRGTYIASRE
ncbi:MAG: hypothetical protein RBT16_02050 [Desulfococcus multivorans]|jgi:polyhydroxyalkanoate synthesis regulator phasin|uniref:hypothetical protein n=1 Tax=Desulfococcus sp. TaxID=2025834 RepID=UPI002A3F0732|nr:hypothetical protein [Desulfococcus multivorans]